MHDDADVTMRRHSIDLFHGMNQCYGFMSAHILLSVSLDGKKRFIIALKVTRGSEFSKTRLLSKVIMLPRFRIFRF